MVDRNIRRRDEQRLGVRQHVEAIFPIVVPHAGRSDTPKRHRLHKQVDVDLIYRAAAEAQFASKAINRALTVAKNKGRQWTRSNRDSAKGLIKSSVGQDRQNRPEDLVLSSPDR